LFKVLFCNTNPIPIKAALKLMGWPVGGLRLPLCELSDTQTQAVAKVLRELELL
jgi:4-hydroxy-tetrahydrodipicolinate synthase